MENLLKTAPEELTIDQLISIVFNSYVKYNYCVRWNLKDNYFNSVSFYLQPIAMAA